MNKSKINTWGKNFSAHSEADRVHKKASAAWKEQTVGM